MAQSRCRPRSSRPRCPACQGRRSGRDRGRRRRARSRDGVRLIPASVDPVTRLGVDADLAGARRPACGPGLFASGWVVTDRAHAVTVPATAVLADGSGARVQVVRRRRGRDPPGQRRACCGTDGAKSSRALVTGETGDRPGPGAFFRDRRPGPAGAGRGPWAPAHAAPDGPDTGIGRLGVGRRPRDAMNISTWSIRHPVPPIAVFLVLLIVGLYSFSRLPVTAMPNIDLPIVQVTIDQPGAAPSELTTRSSSRSRTASHPSPASATSPPPRRDSTAAIVVEFELETDSDRAVNDVKDAVSNVRPNCPKASASRSCSGVDVDGVADPDLCRQRSRRNPSRRLSKFVDDVIGRELSTVDWRRQDDAHRRRRRARSRWNWTPTGCWPMG